jgi:trans-aconitate 2-methyltransferase
VTTTRSQANADWNPQQYGKFAAERAQPFHDLLALIRDRPVARAVDLGCGPGELTRLAADELGCTSMVGIDNSPAMLARTDEHAGGAVRFEAGDIGAWTSGSDLDLVLAAASLQWVPDHASVLGRWTTALGPGGQLAVQVPANANQPTHLVACDVANREPFLSAFGEDGPPIDPVASYVLEPEQYATLLHDLGFTEQHVRLQVYPHLLGNSHDVVEWVRGTTLTRFQKRLDATLFAEFLVAYERALIDVIGEHEPYFFPFRRILMWGRRPI